MGDFYMLLIGLWICSALFGMAQVGQKGYFSGMAWNAGCVFVLVGWWAIPLLLILGPIWLLIAASLEQKQQCPHCRKMIPGSASRCSFCHGEVVPLVTAAAPPSAAPPAMPALVAAEASRSLPESTIRLPEQPAPLEAAIGEPTDDGRTCATCGEQLPSAARFCMRCGAAT